MKGKLNYEPLEQMPGKLLRTSLKLPERTDTETVARAINLENIEVWHDENNKVNIDR